MTLTFKDPNGREWELRAHRVDYGDSRFAEPADLLAALGQLSTGSDGPTDEELWRIDQAALAAVPDDASVHETNTAALRALFAAGRASAESELAATKAKLAECEQSHAAAVNANEEGSAMLAECERERARLEKLLDRSEDDREGLRRQRQQFLKDWGELRSELAGARRVVEAVVDAWARYQRNDLSREEFEGFIAERFETSSPGYALASAGTDAGRSAMRDEYYLIERNDLTQPAWLVGRKGSLSRSWVPNATHATRYTSRAAAESAMADVARESGLSLRVTGHVDVTDADRPEPPRPEAGESGPVCPECGGERAWTACPNCGREPTEEPKPEPQASGEDDARRFLRLARLEPMSPCEAFLADAIEALLRPELRERPAAPHSDRHEGD